MMHEPEQMSLFDQEISQSYPAGSREYRGGNRVSLTALLESVSRLVTSVIYGTNLRESFARLSPDGLWERMYQGCSQVSMDGTLDEYSGTWPAWGIMRGGVCTQPPQSEQFISGRGYSLLPTPLASDGISWTKNNLADVQRSISKTLKRGGMNQHNYLYLWNQISPLQAAEYCETIMGLPRGWTDLNASETP